MPRGAGEAWGRSFWKARHLTAELRGAVERGKSLGHEWVQIVMRIRRTPGNWDRVKVVPGCFGKVVGPLGGGSYLVDVKLADLDRALPEPSKACNCGTPRGADHGILCPIKRADQSEGKSDGT